MLLWNRILWCRSERRPVPLVAVLLFLVNIPARGRRSRFPAHGNGGRREAELKLKGLEDTQYQKSAGYAQDPDGLAA